jgi:hypothetical protein
MTSSGIEPATFWLVACLVVPQPNTLPRAPVYVIEKHNTNKCCKEKLNIFSVLHIPSVTLVIF